MTVVGTEVVGEISVSGFLGVDEAEARELMKGASVREAAYSEHAHPRDRFGRWRYVGVKLPGKKMMLLRVTGETDKMIHGIEVNKEGDEIVPRGKSPEGEAYTERKHVIEKAAIEKIIPHGMNKKYATLEPLPLARTFTESNPDHMIEVPGSEPFQLGGVTPDADTRREIERAFDAIERVHTQSADRDVPKVPIGAWLDGTGADASYAADPDTRVTAYIRVNPQSSRRSVAFAHEWGHYLDQQFLGEDGRWGSRAAVGENGGDHVLRPVMDALVETDTLARINALIGNKITLRVTVNGEPREFNVAEQEPYFRYLLRPHEVFARAYAQWIALRSGDEKMNAEVVREAGPELLAPTQWPPDEFEAVAAAFDAAFEKLGWLHV